MRINRRKLFFFLPNGSLEPLGVSCGLLYSAFHFLFLRWESLSSPVRELSLGDSEQSEHVKTVHVLISEYRSRIRSLCFSIPEADLKREGWKFDLFYLQSQFMVEKKKKVPDIVKLNKTETCGLKFPPAALRSLEIGSQIRSTGVFLVTIFSC